MWSDVTELVIIATIGILIVYDIWMVLNDEDDDTISDVINISLTHPGVPFGSGIIGGHLFWPGAGLVAPFGAIIAVSLIAIVLRVGRTHPVYKRWSPVLFAGGFLVGRIVWGQS